MKTGVRLQLRIGTLSATQVQNEQRKMSYQRKQGMVSVEMLMIIAVGAAILLSVSELWVESVHPKTDAMAKVVLGYEQELPKDNSLFQRKETDGENNNQGSQAKPDQFGEPGIYVLARDLKFSPVGTHQFIVLVPEDPNFPGATDLGNGVKGIVLGAQADAGRLRVRFRDGSDVRATQEYANPKDNVKPWWPDYSTEAHQAEIGNRSVDTLIQNVLDATDNYIANENESNIPYPYWPVGDEKVNSNSWVQSIIEYVVGPGAVPGHFDYSRDLLHENRIPEPYFQ